MTSLVDIPAHLPVALFGQSHALPMIHPKMNTACLGMCCPAESQSGFAANPCWQIGHPSHKSVVLQSDEQASRRVPYGNTSSQGESLPLTPLMTIAEGS
jgi:hypothetical protein